MKDDRIQIKGNKDGVNVNIDMEKFIGFDDMLEAVIKCLSVNKGFYKNSILKDNNNKAVLQNSKINNKTE